MKVELEGYGGIDREANYWSDCDLRYTGIGRKKVNRTVENMEFAPEVNGVVSVGFAGSIDPDFGPGDLCIIDEVFGEREEDSFETSSSLRRRAKLALDHDLNFCKLMTLEDPVTEPEEKKEMAGNSYPLVDQETYWVAKAMKERDIPLFAMRVVFDGIDTELPPGSCYDDYGEVRIPDLLAWLAKHPQNLLDTPRVFLNSLDARRKLTNALDHVLPALLR